LRFAGEILRQTWGQPCGSKRDSQDNAAFHLPLIDADLKALACDRLHLIAADEADVRYMGVAERARSYWYRSRILEALESETRGRWRPESHP
jgi:hypothetical protein